MSKRLYVLAGADEACGAVMDRLSVILDDAGFIGSRTRDIPWHVTLESFDPSMEEELIERVKKAAAQTAPIAITVNHLGIFAGGRVLFAAPDTNHRLLELRENFGDSENWTAHMTLFIDEKERVLQALPRVLEDFAPFGGAIDSLHLYEFFPTRHIMSVKLGGKHDGTGI